MIEAKRLLSDCQALVRDLEADLRGQLEERSDLQALLKREHHEATVAKRTRRSAEEWTAERVTQAAVAWVLGCVFVRFLEDNALVDAPRLSGTGVRLQRARDEETNYFRLHPDRTAREYLEDTFRTVAALPGCRGLFDERHNPLWQLPITGDAARALLERWRAIDPQSGALIHDFADRAWGTRFLGDLYQDLSEAARKQYALLQTPEFIEEFILERTLEPAIDEFGLRTVTLIDPACGSGHFLLGAFGRLLAHWRDQEPGEDVRTHVDRVLAAVAGLDLNPFAAAIARFRLLVAALGACEVKALRNAPDFTINIAVGDSLLHTPRRDRLEVGSAGIRSGLEHVYATEDTEDLRRILGRQYHAVVANPPYITPKDPALNQAYRDRFNSCSGKYALNVPFMELLFDLAVPADAEAGSAGYVGQITANSFMKREFGKRLVEEFLTRIDLSLVIDTAGAYIPGHGTPTVILVGRNCSPVAPTIRTVMGIRGEPATPVDPARGRVWTAILEQVDVPGSQGPYVSVENVDRGRLARHPWSIGGGGASECREVIERAATFLLQDRATTLGVFGMTNADEAMVSPFGVFRRQRCEAEGVRAFLTGEGVRDWHLLPQQEVFFPYSGGSLIAPNRLPHLAHRLWPYRTILGNRATFSKKTYFEEGRPWWEWHQVGLDRLDNKRTIVYSHIATHNHFCELTGEVLPNRSAPIIQLNDDVAEELFHEVISVLNSSTACFWIKQTAHNKGSTVDQHGARQRTAPFEDFYEHTATRLASFPVKTGQRSELVRRLGEFSRNEVELNLKGETPDRKGLEEQCRRILANRAVGLGLQEELDWELYGLYGLTDEILTFPLAEVPPLNRGERAFEIVLARRVAAGEEATTWFERHQATPITEVPEGWPEQYRQLVERRIQVIESNRDIGLIEQPEYKRRWQWEPWEKQQLRTLREWLLNRLEDERYWRLPQLTSCARLADEVRKDPEFRSVAELYAARADVDLAKLVETLVTDEAVPYLAAWRHTEDGMSVRAAWDRTWELQRREDAIDALCALPEDDPHRLTSEQAEARKQVEVGEIPVPPKYTSKHFRRGAYWQLRGKLDVAKERFILYPGCKRSVDPSPVIGWAGWNHLERSQALAQYVTRMRQEERWEADRLTPLLAGLAEQLPWVVQWHNEFDPSLGRRVGEAYADFLSGQLAELGLAVDDLATWRPPEPTRGRRARKVAV